MLSLLLCLTAHAAGSLDEDIDAICSKPESMAVVIVSGAQVLTYKDVKTCTRDGKLLTLTQGESDTIYVNLSSYGTIQIGHGRTTWLRLFS